MLNEQFNYEESFMGVYQEKPKSYVRTFKQDYRLRSLKKIIKLKKGRLLDIGCGGGILTESLPYYYPQAEIFGCDISATAIAYAKKLGSGKVKYDVMKDKKFPFKDNSFDVCISFDVLEHVPDVNFFLQEVRRVLKKDGKLFLIVPCEAQPFTYTWLFQKLRIGQDLTLKYLGHIHPEFTYDYVTNLLFKKGFLIKQKAYSEHFLYQLIQVGLFFLPKVLLEVLLGKKKAQEYTNSSLVKKPKNKKDIMFRIRNAWYFLWDMAMFYPMNWETILLRNVPVGAWKLHVLATKSERKKP